jgi:hypothetical protein
VGTQVYPDRGLNDDGTYSSGYGLFYGGGGELLGCQVRLVRYLCPLPAT